MGSHIELQLDGITLDWGKNAYWTHHGQLFQEQDYRTVVFNEDIEEEDAQELGGTYERPLSKVVGRLDLLGYSLDACMASIRSDPPEYSDPNTDFVHSEDSWMKIDPSNILAVAQNIDLDIVVEAQSSRHKSTRHAGADFGDYWIKEIKQRCNLQHIPDIELQTILEYLQLNPDGEYSPRDEAYHPYAILRLLGSVAKNHNRLVCWNHSDMVSGGWAFAENFRPFLSLTSQVLGSV